MATKFSIVLHHREATKQKILSSLKDFNQVVIYHENWNKEGRVLVVFTNVEGGVQETITNHGSGKVLHSNFYKTGNTKFFYVSIATFSDWITNAFDVIRESLVKGTLTKD